MSGSIYSSLRSRPAVQRDLYRGWWHGRNVEFERVFRGHRFSDGECEALLNGEMLEVHGLERNNVKYSVAGCLVEDRFAGPGSNFVQFKADHTISYDPEYRFDQRIVQMADGPKEPVRARDVASEDEDLTRAMTGVSDDLRDMEAQMAAMLSAPALPEIKKVSGIGEPPVYMPVIAVMSSAAMTIAAMQAAARAPEPDFATE